MVGGILSILIVTGTDAVRPTPFVAEQVKVTPAVSAVRVLAPQPVEEATPDSGSPTSHVTVTLPVYQSLLPNGPATCGTITGGVVSKTTCVVASAALFDASTFPTKSRAIV